MNRSSKLMFLFLLSAISFETNCGREGSSGEISAANARENKKAKHASTLLKTFYAVNKQTGNIKIILGKPSEKYFTNPNVVITNNAKEADRIANRLAKGSNNRPESPTSISQLKDIFKENTKTVIRLMEILETEDATNQEAQKRLLKKQLKQAKKQKDLEDFKQSVIDLTIAGQLQSQ